MTLHDILLEQQLNKMTDLDRAWQRFQYEALELDRMNHRGVLDTSRAGVASILVRLGIWIDRKAGERALTPGS